MALSIGSFATSTAVSIPNPLLFAKRHNPNPAHCLLISTPHLSKSRALIHHHRPSQTLALRCSSVATSPFHPSNILSAPAQTLSALLSLALTSIRGVSEAVVTTAVALTPSDLTELRSLRGCLSRSIGPLFFAAINNRPSWYLNSPLTVVTSGMGKWLDIYSGVLMVRVLLSWFPNIPWDRQPLSAVRDLCDPYLNLFRNIIPPIFDTLDISPLLAFAALGTLGSILRNARGAY